MADQFIQRHFANLRHIRNDFRIDARGARGTSQIAPWLSGVVQLVHPAFPGSFNFNAPTVLTFPDPAATAEFSITVPPNQAWRLRAMSFIFATAAVAATREVLIIFDDGTSVFLVSPAVSVQLTNLIRRYAYGKEVGYVLEDGNNKLQGLPDLILDSGFRIRSLTASLQAGDQFSGIAILIDVFPR